MLEVLNLNENNCADCYKCIRTCSVQGYHLCQQHREIVHDECILCGQLLRRLSAERPKQVRGATCPASRRPSPRAGMWVCSLAPSFIADFRIRSLT